MHRAPRKKAVNESGGENNVADPVDVLSGLVPDPEPDVEQGEHHGDARSPVSEEEPVEADSPLQRVRSALGEEELHPLRLEGAGVFREIDDPVHGRFRL